MKQTEDSRQSLLQEWVTETGVIEPQRIELLAGDASFRKYFRVYCKQANGTQETMVLVDAPPPESIEPFVSIAQAFAQNNVRVPRIFAAQEEVGAMLLEDIGDSLLLSQVESLEERYQTAIRMLPNIMRTQSSRLGELPPYDKALLERENALFSDWLCKDYLKLEIDREEQQLWQSFHDLLIEKALAQPKVGVHRDFHSRNLMLAPDRTMVVIDFQDAVIGPITYDLVSLLRDCYVDWPEQFVDAQVGFAFDLLKAQKLLPEHTSGNAFMHDFDWMGMQRHVKASGIFARLYLRDGKSRYLEDIPHTVKLIAKVAERHAESREFGAWLQERVIPAL